MSQKLLNRFGESLIISSFINAAKIVKKFSKMLHNSWGANTFSLSCMNHTTTHIGGDAPPNLAPSPMSDYFDPVEKHLLT